MSALDLTKHCALCGQRLPYTHGFNFSDSRDRRDFEHRELLDEDGSIDIFEVRCKCEGRGNPGECGTCRACRIERIGCGCDGALDDGCFSCNPTKYERPACPGNGVM